MECENQFTGWEDVELSEQGQIEAKKAGQILQSKTLHYAWTSVLKRAYHTLQIILTEMKQTHIPITHSWRLNERHYGVLQGLNKKQVAKTIWNKQVFQWKRFFDSPPPLISEETARKQAKKEIFKDVPLGQFPRGESLQDTLKSVLPVWQNQIQPILNKNQNVLVSLMEIVFEPY